MTRMIVRFETTVDGGFGMFRKIPLIGKFAVDQSILSRFLAADCQTAILPSLRSWNAWDSAIGLSRVEG